MMIPKTCLLLGVCMVFLSCRNSQYQKCDLSNFLALASDSGTLEYRHVKVFDNKFNSIVYDDTSIVTVFHLENKPLGYYISGKNFAWLFDGKKLVELNHANNTKSVTVTDDINETSHWDKNLLGMIDSLSGQLCVLQSTDKAHYQYSTSTRHSRSKVDSNEVVTTVYQYTIPESGVDYLWYKEIIIRGSDTLQIQYHQFDNIRSNSEPTLHSLQNQVDTLSYQLLDENSDLPFGKPPIKEGDQLQKTEFVDIENNTINIIDHNKKYALIIFSFIGCTPCEIALNHLAKDTSGLRSTVNLYYSSFQNSNEAIKEYLNDKMIFDHAFAKESNMIDAFRLPVAPTFVLIDGDGNIVNIIEGYDDSVLDAIREMVIAR